MKEHDIHATVVHWAKWRANRDPRLNFLIAVPNGAHLKYGKYSFKKLALEGFAPGIPDLLLLYPIKPYCGLALELKSESGKVSSTQMWWLKNLASVGWQVKVAYSADDGIQVIADYLGIKP